jgi:hypothetical protein
MNKRLAAFFGSLVLAVSPAFTPAFAQPAAAPAAAPVAVDPAVNKAVREMLGHLQVREQLAARFQMGANQLPQIVLRANAERINANTKLTLDQKKAEMAIVANDVKKQVQGAQQALADPKLLDDAIDVIVPIYAAKFTLAELNEFNAFQRRPLAVKMRGMQAQLGQDTNAAVQRLMAERVGKLLPKKPGATAK